MLLQFHSKTGAEYLGCPLCKGIWMSLNDVPKVFGTVKALEKLNHGLMNPMPTQFSCPTCTGLLQTGKVDVSDLTLDECTRCQSFFFDDREMKLFFDELQVPELPSVQKQKIDMSQMVKTASCCPVCKDQHLWSVKGQIENFASCLKCGGTATNVESLQKTSGRSIFSPTMFVFPPGQGLYSVCRFCSEPQEPNNKSCRKCGREMLRAQCLGCSGRMSEYILGDVIIERCQLCNSIWLDDQEFAKVLTSMPDIRRHYEQGVRESELFRTEILAASHVYRLGLEQTNRDMIIRFWGMASVFWF
jgi:Zn-finger nucleic acid-binding protein